MDNDYTAETVPVVGSNGKLWWASCSYFDCIGFAIHANKEKAFDLAAGRAYACYFLKEKADKNAE